MDRRQFLLSGLALALLGAAPPLPPRRFASSRLSVTVTGSGPDVILIPGLAASPEVWRGTVAALPGYRYHLVQVAGFAGAPAGGNARGAIVAPLAEEIARYIAETRLGKPALVGHSMGGTLAMMVAARYPARIGKLMVVDMLPEPAGLMGSTAANARGLAEALGNLTATAGGRSVVTSLMGLFGNEEKPDKRSDPDVVARATRELAALDLGPELAAIKAPTTIVYAALDETRRVSADRTYSRAYARKRDARLVRIDDSGHMIMYDQPARFRAALRSFLA
jgi:N-formylmaleamate deformylase